jgi:hypothetical protein
MIASTYMNRPLLFTRFRTAFILLTCTAGIIGALGNTFGTLGVASKGVRLFM